MKISPLISIAVLSIALLSSCAGSRKATAPHPMVGEWSYSLETPMGPENGVLTVSEGETGLAGSIIHMGGPESMTLETITFEDGALFFQLRAPGLIRVNGTVVGNDFVGTVENVTEGVSDIPIKGIRKVQ